MGQTPLSTPVVADSANKANAAAVAVLPAVAGKTTYISGFRATASGATAGLPVVVTVADGSWTLSFVFVFPAGVLVAAAPLVVDFPEPIPASGPGQPITVTLPAGGAGNTNAAVNANGYQL